MSFMNATLQPPPEFYRFAGSYCADGFEGETDPREAIKRTLGWLDSNGRRVLKEFLTDLLNSNPSEADLQKLWNTNCHFYYIVGRGGNDGMRMFLDAVRNQID